MITLFILSSENKKPSNMDATASVSEEEKKISTTAERFCHRFSLPEVQLATADFSAANIIGEGGFGKVYKGVIDDHGPQTVAIKRLSPNSNQGKDEFLMEIETLSKLRHVNLVSLIGYCNEQEEMILVYEYIARGTLADHLYKRAGNNDDNSSESLTWKKRLDICIGAARGLDYLHTGSFIIHRDVKSTNILLDENLVAKVSDFGLAKHFNNSKSHVSTIAKGSIGYLDPSYFTTCRLTINSDTYAFGVVLLEVLCGRAAVDARLGVDEVSLSTWAQEKISKRKVEQIVASNLRAEISADCLKTFVGVVKRCLNPDPKKRPTMARVVAQLELAIEQQERNVATHNASQFLSLNAIWNMIRPAGDRAIGSTEKNQGQMNTISISVPATEEEALKEEESINMHVPAITADELEHKQSVTMSPSDVPAIPPHEFKKIINKLTTKRLIGEGSNRRVYRVRLKNGQVAAIKRQNQKFEEQVWRDFEEQASIASSIKHENMVQLLGYCVHDYEQFWAYEFAPNGSLHDILHGRQGAALSWAQRVKIAVGAAQGLEYIHKKGQIHRNIKSTNILVFDDLVAKIADFGLSTESPYGLTEIDNIGYYHPSVFATRPRGYHPPEYTRYGKVSCKTDVYSFGAVLLELLTGSTIVGNIWPVEPHLVTWATPMLREDKVEGIVDARLEGNYPPKAVAKMAKIAALCVQSYAEYRPDMSTVEMVLRSLENT